MKTINLAKLINKRRSPANGSNTSSVGGVTSLILLSMIIGLGGLVASLLFSQDTFAVTITMSSSGAQSIDIMPDSSGGTGTSIGVDNLNIVTDCRAGYNLSISTSVNDNNLYLNGSSSNNQSGKYFSPASGSSTLANSPNTWGYLESSTVPTATSTFSAVPALGNIAVIRTASQTASSSDISDNIDIYYGVAVSNGLAPGTYKMIPDTNNSNADGSIVYYLTMETSCEKPYMQDATNDSLATAMPSAGDTYALYDKRDEQAYTVAKLADGNYWTIDNLNLGATALSTDLNSSNTNMSTTVTASTFNSWKKTSGSSSYTAAEYIPITASNSADGRDTDPTSLTKYGTLYNFCAVSAGTICADTSRNSATSDLCPSGWHMPADELNNLLSYYDTSAKLRAPATSNGAGFSLAGYFQTSTPVNQGSQSRYWTSLNSSAANVYQLSVTTSTANYSSQNRATGRSVRCIKTPDYATTTVNFAGSGVSSVTFANATYGNQTVSTSGGTVSLKTGAEYTVTMSFSSGYEFSSWASTSGVLGSTSANPTTYTVTGTSTLTATGKSSGYPLKINFGTGIYGVMVKSGSITGGSMGVVTTSGGTVTLTSTSTKYYLLPLYKSGYTFSSWSASGGTVTSDTSASGGYGYYYYTAKSGVTNTATITATTLTTAATSTSLTAMQNLSASTCTHAPKAVRDTRDNAVYYIQRLADGKCWMLENLRLGSTSTIPLTTSNTNSNGNYTLPASGTVCFATTSNCDSSGDSTHTGYTVAAINTASKTTTKIGYGPGRNYVGVYYNYCAASAGTICTASNSSNASYDICPAGWKMPTTTSSNNSAGSYYYLYNTGYNANQVAFRYALSTPLSGIFSDGSAGNQGILGNFWSATRGGSSSNMRILRVSSSSVSPALDISRYVGYSVRCLLK